MHKKRRKTRSTAAQEKRRRSARAKRKRRKRKRKEMKERRKKKETGAKGRRKRRAEQTADEEPEGETPGGSKAYDLEEEIRTRGTILAPRGADGGPARGDKREIGKEAKDKQGQELLERVPPRAAEGKYKLRVLAGTSRALEPHSWCPRPR